MQGNGGKCPGEEKKRSQRDEEVTANHNLSLRESRGWDERFPMSPPCELRVGGYQIEYADEKGIGLWLGDLFGRVCLRAVGYP